MADSQKMGSKVESGGQRIDDHSSWIGAGSKSSVFPEGVKTRVTSSAEGAGSVARYEDTDEAIRATQEMNKRQVKARPLKAGYRN